MNAYRAHPAPPAAGPHRPLPAITLLAAAALAWLGCGVSEEETPVQTVTGERAPVEASTTVDRAVATTGDVITYSVIVDHDAAYEIELAEPGAEIAGFRIFDFGRDQPTERNGRRVETRWYKLRADIVGSYVLPPVRVSYRPASADGGGAPADWQTVDTSAIFVEVESVLPADGEASDIRGLKPLREVREGPPWPWIGAGALLLALTALAAWAWWRRPRPLAPPVPAHVLAFGDLETLRGTDFDDPEAVRRFHFRISEILRTYVEGRWGLNATDLTTEEILPELAGLDELSVEQATRLASFLRSTDRVKFAEHRPPAEEVEGTWEAALGFVEATVPQAAETEGEEAPREVAA